MSMISPRRSAVIAGVGAAVTLLLVAPLTVLAATSGSESAPAGLPMALVMPLGLVIAFVAEMVVLLFRVNDPYGN